MPFRILKARWGIRGITKLVSELLLVRRVAESFNSLFEAISRQGRLICCLLRSLRWSGITRSFRLEDILLVVRNRGLATNTPNGVCVVLNALCGFSMFTANIGCPFVQPQIVEVNNWWMPGKATPPSHSVGYFWNTFHDFIWTLPLTVKNLFGSPGFIWGLKCKTRSPGWYTVYLTPLSKASFWRCWATFSFSFTSWWACINLSWRSTTNLV